MGEITLSKIRVDTIVDAYDSVIPGYAWAWHDANLAKQCGRVPSQGWRHPLRKNLDGSRDRCITLYGFKLLTDPPTQNYGLWDTGGDLRNCPLPSLLGFNRGYVALFCAVFADPRGAMFDLYEIGLGKADDATMDDLDNDSRKQMWLTRDATPFPQRCQITLNALQYVKDKSDRVIPLWQTAKDLARAS